MTTQNMPVLALRGLTAFPGQTLSFDAEREISILALENAMEGDRELLLVTQREIGVQDPQEEDLYEIGTVCRIFQIVKTSDTGVRVIAGGLHRAALRRLWQTKPFLQANVELLEDQSWRASDRTEALTRRTYALFGQYHELVGNLSDQLVASVLDIRDPGLLADTIAANINLRHQDRQRVLQELHPARRLLVMNEILVHEVDIAVLESDIDQKVRQRVGQVQRDMVLREQLHVLQHELGEDGDDELLDCLLPKMTLQPIVENCVFHGLEPKAEQGHVTIRISGTKDMMKIIVEDDGVGMSPDELDKMRAALEEERQPTNQPDTHGNGIAMYNVNQRIKLAFGRAYGLSVYSTESLGTDVEIWMPQAYTKEELLMQ